MAFPSSRRRSESKFVASCIIGNSRESTPSETFHYEIKSLNLYYEVSRLGVDYVKNSPCGRLTYISGYLCSASVL